MYTSNQNEPVQKLSVSIEKNKYKYLLYNSIFDTINLIYSKIICNSKQIQKMCLDDLD